MIHLDKEDLYDVIAKGNYLVDFYAEWCGPCKMMGEVLENIKDKINIVKVDIDKFEDLANENKVMSVPTLMFFKDGEKLNEIVGFYAEDDLLKIIEDTFK